VTAAAHRQQVELDHGAVTALVGMGPHARHLARDTLTAAVAALPQPVSVTVSVDVATYRRAD
jgi:23S rRNA (guanine745-N1)-methyltransferase